MDVRIGCWGALQCHTRENVRAIWDNVMLTLQYVCYDIYTYTLSHNTGCQRYVDGQWASIYAGIFVRWDVARPAHRKRNSQQERQRTLTRSNSSSTNITHTPCCCNSKRVQHKQCPSAKDWGWKICVCVCVCMRVSVCAWMCVCVNACKRVCCCVCVCVPVCFGVCDACACLWVFSCILWHDACIWVTHTDQPSLTSPISTHTHIHVSTHTHTYIYTCMQYIFFAADTSTFSEQFFEQSPRKVPVPPP